MPRPQKLPLRSARVGTVEKVLTPAFCCIVLEIGEEERFVAAVVDVRDFERAAHVAAEALVVIGDFGKLVSGDRIGARVEGRVGDSDRRS